ncbi:cell wall hydrolase [Sphingomonas sp.]|uniref:cell wall hydrolase n=1 Tax=Sphingomonas sp. TaxID=28214 RepID=UPI003B3B3C04
MSLKRPNTLYAGAGAVAALAAMALLPASMGSAAELIAAPTLTYDLESTTPSATPAIKQAAIPAAQTADLKPQDEQAEAAEFDEASHVCVAKVVLHEAGNQSRAGKVAVAQTLVNRLKAGRFGESICAVANQPGQYFDLSGYRPNRDSDNWADAMDVAHDVLRGEAEAVAPGALFFRANYAPTNSFFRGRKRVTEVGAHVFYR